LTLTDQILAFVRDHPNVTAWGVAKNLNADLPVVSSILSLKVRKGILERVEGVPGFAAGFRIKSVR